MREKKNYGKQKNYIHFVREMPEITDEKETWHWLRKADLKVETEAKMFAVQEQAIGTNYLKHTINKTAQSPLCRMFDKKSETISHIVSKCGKLVQKEYKKTHDNVARIVHWNWCVKCNLKRSKNGMNMLEKVLLKMKN